MIFIIPGTVREIGKSVFCDRDSLIEGPPLFRIDDDFIISADFRALFGSLSPKSQILIGLNIPVIASNAFRCRHVSAVLFERGARLREIGSRAFSQCRQLKALSVQESVEIFGDRCFECLVLRWKQSGLKGRPI
jgi:hypothetical protein